MYGNKKISCVIPCHNEEEGLEKILRDKPACIDEVIVVDNHSTDNTAEVARKNGSTVVFEEKKGYGYAYQAGLPKASGDIIVMLDGDSSYPLTEVEKSLAYMKAQNLDFFAGCRYPLTDKNSQPPINQAANCFFSWLIRILFGINLRDSQSGLMAFKKDILDKIMVDNPGMAFSQEIKIKAFLNKGIKCGSQHVFYIPRVGKSKFRKIQDSMNTISSVVRMRKRLSMHRTS